MNLKPPVSFGIPLNLIARILTGPVIFVFVISGMAPQTHATTAPNIVLLFSDDAGYADFGFSSQQLGLTTEFRTPNLDALASKSVVATAAYVTSSTCAVSRAGMLTGRYQQRFGFHYNALPADLPNEGVPASENLIFEQMKSMGYATGVIGKWHIGEQEQWQPQNQGVDYFFGMLDGANDYFYSDSTNSIYRNANLVNWGVEPSFNNIAPDPVRGRELTDTFADESTQFIANHANGSEPFFLYTAFNSPHGPFQAKSADVAEFNGTSLSSTRKVAAGMTLAMDRAVGLILDRLEDPNGDGNKADSVLDNTIIVFANDNGGANPSYHNNSPLEGLKGSAYEGGIRVPAFVYAPGLTPGVYDKQISTLDFFPTFVAAAGGAIPANLDGVDLMPYLSGANTNAPHDYLYTHNRQNFSAVQDGEWKFVKPEANDYWRLYHLNPDGTGEDVDVSALYPEKVAELTRAFVDFEVQTEKPLNSTETYIHFGNTFVFRNIFPNTSWSTSGAWLNEEGQSTGLNRVDSTSNLIVVLKPDNNVDYGSIVSFARAASHSPTALAAGHPDLPGLGETLLNEVRLEGSFTGAGNRTASLTGNTLMVANNQEGRVAQIGLHATDDSPTGSYTYNIAVDVVLYNDLHLTGDGTANFQFTGDFRDFYTPRSLIKQGSSHVKLTGQSTFAGDLLVEGGQVEVAGGGITNARYLVVDTGAEYRQTGGDVAFDTVIISPAATTTLTGGVFTTSDVVGDLVNNGAVFKASDATRMFLVNGDLTLAAGSLDLELGGLQFGVDYDHFGAAGLFTAGADLNVSFTDGFMPTANDQFWLLDAGNFAGSFSTISLPALAAGLSWDSSNLLTTGVLRVSQAGILPEDFNADHAVNGADLSVWETSFGQLGGRGDADADYLVDGSDFLAWQRSYGQSSNFAATPEPASLAIAAVLAACAVGYRRTNSRKSSNR
ncbi:MAG: sulfatase-like hydrolase/transferase [Planctomycetales bacterium]|nr:sulfatase-like hydrolase/transferase [Planctomycetales bacterium]